MTLNLSEIVTALPEIVVLTMVCLTLVADLYFSRAGYTVAYPLAQLTLLIAFVVTIFAAPEQPEIIFSGAYISDQMALICKLFIYAITAAGFVSSKEYLKARNLFKGEYYVLGLFGVLGMMVMVSAHSFLTIYLGLELLSLSLYALVALDRDSERASEAAMKYFVLGALASGMLLYGMSMIYGATGSLDILQISLVISADAANPVILAFGSAFIVAGLAFKLGAVPFHMWVPDIYHGAPTPVTFYIGTAPKIAAFVLVMRVLVEGLQGVYVDWQAMLIVLAVLSLGVGNLIAIAQVNLKRMLAYSTISHVGFLLLGILSGNLDGYAASMFYAISYAIMASCAFGMILLLSREGFEADRLEDYKGLADRSPWYAFLMLITMFSMAGVPPLLGFYAKFAVLKAVVDIGMVWLAVVAVAFSIIGAFYYLRIVKLMYFDSVSDEDAAIAITPGKDTAWVLSSNALALILLGLFPGLLLSLCVAAMH